MRWPDFFIVGTPKGGTTALHAALVGNPQLHMSAAKEPKFFLCDGTPPARSMQRGPGDAHSAREWIWREPDYLRLFADVPSGILAGESTPFYLYDREAQRRIAEKAPAARLIAVIRDPVACKPAVIAETDDWVAMASEYRAIAALPGADHAKIWEPAPATVYAWSHAA